MSEQVRVAPAGALHGRADGATRSQCKNVPYRTDGIGNRADDDQPMVNCPRCGSDRVVELTFTRLALPDIEERPVAECTTCGCRLYEDDLARQEDASSSRDSGPRSP